MLAGKEGADPVGAQPQAGGISGRGKSDGSEVRGILMKSMKMCDKGYNSCSAARAGYLYYG